MDRGRTFLLSQGKFKLLGLEHPDFSGALGAPKRLISIGIASFQHPDTLILPGALRAPDRFISVSKIKSPIVLEAGQQKHAHPPDPAQPGPA